MNSETCSRTNSSDRTNNQFYDIFFSSPPALFFYLLYNFFLGYFLCHAHIHILSIHDQTVLNASSVHRLLASILFHPRIDWHACALCDVLLSLRVCATTAFDVLTFWSSGFSLCAPFFTAPLALLPLYSFFHRPSPSLWNILILHIYILHACCKIISHIKLT